MLCKTAAVRDLLHLICRQFSCCLFAKSWWIWKPSKPSIQGQDSSHLRSWLQRYFLSLNALIPWPHIWVSLMFFCAYLTVSGEVYQKSTTRKRLCLLLKSAVDVIHSYLLFREATNGQCLILYRNNLVVCVEAYKVFFSSSHVSSAESYQHFAEGLPLLL